jgi:hypothetical protein
MGDAIKLYVICTASDTLKVLSQPQIRLPSFTLHLLFFTTMSSCKTRGRTSKKKTSPSTPIATSSLRTKSSKNGSKVQLSEDQLEDFLKFQALQKKEAELKRKQSQ